MNVIDVRTTWVSNYRYPITKSSNWVTAIGYPSDRAPISWQIGVRRANYDENFVKDTIMTMNSSTDFINENFDLNRFEIVSPKTFSLVYRHLIPKLWNVLHNDLENSPRNYGLWLVPSRVSITQWRHRTSTSCWRNDGPRWSVARAFSPTSLLNSISGSQRETLYFKWSKTSKQLNLRKFFLILSPL